MSAKTVFDETEPNRSDLRLILRALRNGWPVDPAKRASIEAFCMRSKLEGRFDRLTALAGEVLEAFRAVDEIEAANGPEQAARPVAATGKPPTAA